MKIGMLHSLFLIFICSCSSYKSLDGSLIRVNNNNVENKEDINSKSVRILQEVGDRSGIFLDSLELLYGRQVGYTMSFLDRDHYVLKCSFFVFSQMNQNNIEVALTPIMLVKIKEQIFADPIPGLKKVLVTLKHEKLSKRSKLVTLNSYD